MKKRALSFLLVLLIALSVFPQLASAAGTAGYSAEEAIPISAANDHQYGGVISAEVFTRLSRLGGLNGTKAYAISEATRNAVCDVIYAGLKNWDETIDVSEFELPVEDGYACFRSVLDAHLELFYVQSTSFSYGDGIMFELHPFYDTTYTKSSVTTFNNLCASVIAGMPNGTDPEKLLYLHDWLVTHCEYDLTYNNVTAYNAMVDGRAVCDGYAKAYKHLCDLAGLDCEYVSSEVNNHAWNMVMLNVGGLGPAYYYIDCTWDDPTNGSGLTAEMNCDHTFFLQCKEECMEKHKGSDWLNGAGENIYNNPTTEYFRFGNGWWKSLNRPVQWVGTQMCYAKPTENGKVYFRSSGSATETAMAIPGGGTPWYVFGGGGSYGTAYITPASLGGAFYFTTPTQIYKLTTDGTMSLVYTLTSAQQAKGYLYGIQAGSAGLTYYIGEDPLHPSVATGTLTFPPAVDSITADKTSASVGQTITWTAAASGGNGTLRYCFYIYKDGTKVASNSYGSAKTYTYTPTEPGVYTAKAFVKDSAGVAANKMSTGVTVSSTPAPLSVTGITANKTSAAVGESITWTASATGGSGTLKYCFYIYNGGTVVQKGSYTTTKTASYTPTAAGTYTAKVFVKDGAGQAASKMSTGVTVTAGAPVVSSITADKTSAAVNETITWTAAATGGSGTLKYCFYIYKDGTVVQKGSYTITKTVSYTPTAAGTYTAKVFVKDSAGQAASKMSTGIAVTQPLTITSLAPGSTNVILTEPITWWVTATGGVGQLRYCFYLYEDGTRIQSTGYGTADYFSFTPTEIGAYTVKVFVRDSTGKTISQMCGTTVWVTGA